MRRLPANSPAAFTRSPFMPPRRAKALKEIIGGRMQRWIVIVAALLIGTPAHAQSDAASGTVFLPSCLAAVDIVQGKRPAADSVEAAAQLRKAAICFGAVTAIMNLEPLFKADYAACPPAGSKVTSAQVVVIVTDYLKSHPEQLQNNFHQLAVGALAAAWPCSK